MSSPKCKVPGCGQKHAAHECSRCGNKDSTHLSFHCTVAPRPDPEPDRPPPRRPSVTPPPPTKDPSLRFCYHGSIERDDGAPTDPAAEEGSAHIRVWYRWDGANPDLSAQPDDPWVPYPSAVCKKITEMDGDTVDVGYGYNYVKGAKMQVHSVDVWKQRWVRGCSICWKWNADEPRTPKYRPYGEAEQWHIEEAYARGERRTELCTNGDTYVIYLRTTPMLQVLKSDPTKERFVRRIGPPNRRLEALDTPAYWNDVVPMELVNANPGASAIMPLPREHPVHRRVQELMNQCIAAPHMPGVGEIWDKDPKNRKHPKSFQVTKVSVVMNRRLWTQYEDMRKHLAEKYKDAAPPPVDVRTSVCPPADLLTGVNEGWYFHGTGPIDARTDIIDSITKGFALDDTVMLSAEDQIFESQGMNARYSSPQGMFGGGVYLADLSSKANLYVTCPSCFGGAYRGPKVVACTCTEEPKGEYRMLLCRALLGKVYHPRPDMGAYDEKVFKVRNPLLAIPGDYDSVVAEKGVGCTATYRGLAFREIMVYDGAQVYPEIIVEYKRIP